MGFYSVVRAACVARAGRPPLLKYPPTWGDSCLCLLEDRLLDDDEVGAIATMVEEVAEQSPGAW